MLLVGNREKSFTRADQSTLVKPEEELRIAHRAGVTIARVHVALNRRHSYNLLPILATYLALSEGAACAQVFQKSLYSRFRGTQSAP